MSVNILTKVMGDKVQEEFLRPSKRAMIEQLHLIPDWLQRASEEDRQYYLDTEQSLTKKEQALDILLREMKSLKDFVNFHVREIVRTETDELIDPDQVFVNARHTFYVGQQKVIQCNRLTLSEFVLNGAYDAATVPLEITLEGETLPAGLTRQFLLEDLRDTSLRSAYAILFEEKYRNEAVLQALQSVLESRTALSAFSAKLQGHISDESLKIVDRASQNAENYSLGALSFEGWKHAFQGMIVYCGPEGEGGTCVLYAPEAPGGRIWYEFASIRQLNFHLFEWTTQPVGRSYLSRQSHASERGLTDAYMRRVLELPSQWRGIQRSPWPSVGAGVLRQGVLLNVGWLRGEMEAVIPAGYRSASSYQRQYFARLNTELKALTRLATREAALISYERFAFNLIKRKVEDVLAENGVTIAVNPDLMTVELDESQEMTLSQLIIKEHHITEDSGPIHNPGIYPRLRLSDGHPAISDQLMSDVLMQYIVGWSKTLRPGEKYIDMLSADYLDENAPGYALKRDVYVNVQLHEMQRAALAEFFSGRLTRQQSGDIERAIDRLREPEPSDRWDYEEPESPQRNGVYTFHLEGRRIEGVYVFRTMNKGVAKDLLYTPYAPDDRWFRPLTEFARSVKVKCLGSYYCKRAKFTDQRVVNAYIEQVQRSSADVEPPRLQFDSRVRDFSRSYTNMIGQIIDGVDAQTTSLIEIVGKLAYDAAVAAVTVVGCVFPPIGFGLSAVVMAKGVFDGARAYHEGDYKALFASYLDCMLELATMRIGKLGFSPVQKAIAKRLGDANTCLNVVSACSGTTVDLAVMTALMKEALEEPESSEQTLLA
ncbi:dermonecrotic toxin domain-containing protein [Pseudomonas sp. NPDC087697]|uniref:dermonecrotic toxin domain-containing protein n=1 Tax=Pseudomonas sp. NPDC087697 TaxID=3364447 RepID=UPI003820F3AC